jgi:hypothetical protein
MKTSPNASKSFKRFMQTFKRSGAMIGAAEAIRRIQNEKPGASALSVDVPDDMLRAAVVLTVAGMDAYFTDRFCEGLGPYLRDKNRKPTPALIAMIEQSGFTTGEAISAMVTMDRPMRRVNTLLRIFLTGYTTTNVSKIDDLYSCMGIKKFSHHASANAKKPKILSLVTKAVHRRHEIAHGGDMNDHGKMKAINTKACSKMLLAVQNFVASAEEILETALPVPKGAKTKQLDFPIEIP